MLSLSLRLSSFGSIQWCDQAFVVLRSSLVVLKFNLSVACNSFQFTNSNYVAGRSSTGTKVFFSYCARNFNGDFASSAFTSVCDIDSVLQNMLDS